MYDSSSFVCGIVMSCGIVMRISRQPFPVKITIDQKQLENVESFKYLGSILNK
jgi:hypothetical protein